VPVPGVFAASVNVPLLHCSWSVPATEVVGVALFVSTSSSKLTHEPFVIVHLKTADEPTAKPVTVLLFNAAFVIVADPDCNDHTPVPVTGAFAFNVKDELLH
jgi:hypothetical protein